MSLNLRGIANAAIQGINPNISIVVSVPNGYTIDPATLFQVPAFTTVTAPGNVQALDGDDLKQISGLNIQGSIRAVYLYGAVAGIIRPDAQPSAVLAFAHGGLSGDWGVFKVLETWQDWCKVAVVYQVPAP